MNKYLLLTVISMLFMGTVFSQQKVKDRTVEGNTLPNSNAILELESTNKGLLHTRVMLIGSSDATPLSQHVAGMMVYNTATTNDVVPGIYYNDGTKWVLAGAVANGANHITYDPIAYEITYIDDQGDPQTIDLSQVIKANETVTALVDNGDGTYTYTNEAGATTLIDVPGSVADNFEDILGNPNVQALLDEFIKGKLDGAVTFDGVAFSYVDGDGNPQVLTLSALVQANETVTTLIGNGDGTYSYTSEDGTVVTFDANTSTVTDNGDGTYTITGDDGTAVTIDVAGDVLTELQDNTSDVHNEVLSLINNQIAAGSDALVDNGDGTFTHTAEDGTVVTFDANTSTVTDNGDGTYTITSDDGTAVTIDIPGDVLTEIQDNTSDIHNEVLSLINNQIAAGSDALVDNGDGTFTHTAVDGTVVTFDANTSTVTDNGDGTYTITSDDGTAVTIDIPGDVLTEIQDNTSDIHNEVLSLINNQIAAGSDALVDNGDGTFTHTAVDGTVVTFDANTSTVTDNGDGTYTITNADGTTVTIDVVGDVLTELQDNTSGIHTEILTLINNQIAAGSDALVDNGDGTFTHTAVDGTVVTFDANTSTITDNGDGTYTVTNVDGTSVTIDVAGDVLTELQDNTSDIHNEVLSLINNEIIANSDALVDNGDGTFTHTAADGTVVTFDANTSTITDNGDGTYTVNNVDGTTVTIDVAGDVLTELQDNTSDIYTEVLSLINNEIIANSDALVDNGDGTFTHTAVDGTVVTFDANTSTITDNGDGTYTVTNVDGTSVTIDVAGDVLTELQDNTSDIYTEIQSIISANSDALVDNGDGTFTHTAVDGTVVSFDANTSTITDNGDGTYTVTNVDGTTVTIDVAGDVLTELQDNTSDIHNEILTLIGNEIVANSDVLVDNGDGTFTHTAADGTVVTFDANTSTVTDNGDGTYTITNADGTTAIIDVAGDVLTEIQDNTSDIHTEIQNIISANSDALVDNGDGTFTHTAVDGTTVTFDANTSTITDNGDGTYTITNADGTTVTIDVAGDVLTELQDNTSDIYNEIQNIITAGGDALVDNGDGTFTHTAVDGTVVTFDANTSTVTDNGDGTYTVTNGDGTTVTIDVAGDVLTELQDNTSDIYNEIQNIISANSDALVDNGDGTFTHTAVDGTVVTFDANTSTITDNGDGTYTVTNVDGTTVTIDVAGDVLTELQDNTSDIYNEIRNIISANSDALVDNGDGTFTHTAVDGTVVTFDANTSTITDNGDGTYTVTNVDGTTVTIDVAGDVLTELQDNTSDIYNEIQNIITAGGDALVDNGDGTFTHTAVDGTVVTFDANTSTVTDNGDGTYTVTNGDGTTVTIDVAGDVLTELQDNTSDIYNEIQNIITAGGDALVDNGDGTFTHTAVDGTVVTFDANTSTVTDNGDGTYTVTNGDGTTVTIDVAGDVLTELQDNTSDIYNEIRNIITAGSDALVDNGDGTFTHTAVDGTVVTFDANTSTITDNGDGTYTVTNVDGTTVTIDVAGDVLTELQDNTSDIYNEIQNIISANSDALVDNGDGTFTHTAVDGTTVTFDANTSTITDNGDGTYTITNADGTTVTIDVAGDVLTELQDNTSDIHNEVLSLINNEIIANSDALIDNGDGTFTHTAVDGTAVTFDANTSTVTDNGDGTYTVTNVDGTSVTIDVAGDVLTELQDNTSDIYNEIRNIITAGSDALVDNGDGTFTHTAVDGTAVTFDVTRSEITDNGDGTYTVIDQDGNTVTIDVAGDVLTELQDNTSDIYTEVVNVIETNETTTTLAINAGSLEYTNEDDSNADVNLISADANNALVPGADGALFVPAQESINIYNANGTLTDNREVTLDGNSLTFQGTEGYVDIETGGESLTLRGTTPNGTHLRLSTDDLNGNGESSIFNMDLFSDNYLQMLAEGEMNGITFGTHNTLNPSRIEFVTSSGGGALGEARITIKGDGNINFTQYPNTRDDSGSIPVGNILYTDDGGNLLSAPVANLAIEPWQVQTTTDKATDNSQDIYQTGSVAIGTDDIPALVVDGDDLTSTVKLHVDGNISTTGKLYTTNSMYADYVFEKYFNGHSDLNTKYKFASLKSVKNFIRENHHLPGVTPVADLSKSANGYTFDLTSLSIQQLEKIEELFIHTIEQQELLDKQQEQLKRQQEELKELKDRLAKIEQLLLNQQ